MRRSGEAKAGRDPDEKGVRFNRGGLICVGLHTSYVLFMLAVAYLAIDDKTRGFFVALSALPGWLVVGAMPQAPMEWLLVNHYPVVAGGVYLVSFAVAYLSFSRRSLSAPRRR